MPLRNMIAKLRAKWSGRVPSRRAPKLKSRQALGLELLESRDLMAVSVAPKIIAIVPPDGGTLVEAAPPTQNIIKVTYSEAMSADAATKANYLLFDPNGNAVAVQSVTEEGTSNTYDVAFNSGQPAGAYTLFVEGDQVHASAAVGGLPLADPGQLVVANSGSGSNAISTVAVPDLFNAPPSTLSATQTYAIGLNAGNFFTPDPAAVTVGDFNGDGFLDVAIASASGTGTEIEIYSGKASGGFDATPDQRLTLQTAFPVSIVAFSETTAASKFEDLAVLNQFNQLEVITNTGVGGPLTPGAAGSNPTFNAGTTVATGTTNGIALAAADFNGDGKTDLAVLDGFADGQGNFNINFLQGAGGGNFNAPVKFAVGNTTNNTTTLQNPTSFAVGHLQTATSVDLAVGGSNGVETILNNTPSGNSGNISPTTFKVGQLINSTTKAGLLNNVSSVAIGNLDGDGSNDPQDIAAVFGGNGVTPGSTNVEVLVNSDSGTGLINPATSTTINLGAGFLGNLVTVAPQTPGGPANIVVVTSSLNQVTVLRNTSSSAVPAFGPATHYTVDVNPVAVAVGDLNGDATPDIITANAPPSGGAFGPNGTFSVLRNNGDGTYGAPTVLTAAAPQPVSVVVGDVNGDGIPDLVVANKSANTVTVYLASSTTPGAYGAGVTYSTLDLAGKGSSPVSVTLAFLTGPGGPLDIITANAGDNTVSILLGNGDGTFKKATTIAVGASPTQVAAGVFVAPPAGQAGKVSLAIAHNGTGASLAARGVTLLLGNGDGTFQPIQEILPNVAATAIVAGNFASTLGGPVDLAVADDSNGTVDLLRNNGQGVFTHAAADTFDVGAHPSALAVGDFNQDGFQDVVAVSSDTTGAAQQIAVLLNSGGDGFAAALFTPLPFNLPVNSVAVDYLNGDETPDLVVGLTGGTINNTFFQNQAPADANIYTLIGNGDGTFSSPVPYMTGPKGNNTIVAVASDALVRATTFFLQSTTVDVDLIKNGGFEAHDLDGTPGTFAGWETANITNSRGGWYLQSGNLSPLSQTPVTPPTGGKGANVYQAMADQSNLQPLLPGPFAFNPNAASTYSGSNFLYQDITLPGTTNPSQLSFSLNLYINSAFNNGNGGGFTSGVTSLDYNLPGNPADQQVRVDFIDPNAPIDTTNVLLSLFQTTGSTPQVFSTLVTATAAQLATLLTGSPRTIRLRIAEVNNQGRLTVGVDNASFKIQYTDTTAPTLTGPQLRNPGYPIVDPVLGTIPSTTDPTLTGQVSDDGGVANIRKVEFSLDPTFVTGDDVIGPTSLDATGHFSVTLPNLVPTLAPLTVYVRVTDVMPATSPACRRSSSNIRDRAPPTGRRSAPAPSTQPAFPGRESTQRNTRTWSAGLTPS